jgi:hypothetical protein
LPFGGKSFPPKGEERCKKENRLYPAFQGFFEKYAPKGGRFFKGSLERRTPEIRSATFPKKHIVILLNLYFSLIIIILFFTLSKIILSFDGTP